MSEAQTIEAEEAEEAKMALAPMIHAPLAVVPGVQPVTAAQAKVDAVAALTMAAYEKAATLKLTPEESAALQADFPDEAFQPGAAGKENLLYVEHAHLRDRFSKVFGMGKWAIVPRSRWAEQFKTSKGQEASRVYVEAMLVVRGCFVGEAVGAMEYYPSNATQNYGDAVEGAKTAAFRRCAKEFGVGLQAWKKEWCEGWWQRKRAKRHNQAPPPAAAAKPEPQTIEGVIEEISKKTGTKKDGKPWTAWGIKIRGEWYRTFSATTAEIAEANKGKPVKISFTKTDKGNNAETIITQEAST